MIFKIKPIKKIIKSVIFLLFFSILSFGQESNVKNNNWLQPLNIGLEFSNITYIGPIVQYELFNSFQITCKLEYNLNTEEIFILPGLKYKFTKQFYGFTPHVGSQYSKLDHIKYNKMYWNGMEILGYWVMDVYVPAKSTKQENNLKGIYIFTGIDYPVGKLLLNVSIGSSYFNEIEEDNSKYILTYNLGLFYSFNNSN